VQTNQKSWLSRPDPGKCMWRRSQWVMAHTQSSHAAHRIESQHTQITRTRASRASSGSRSRWDLKEVFGHVIIRYVWFFYLIISLFWCFVFRVYIHIYLTLFLMIVTTRRYQACSQSTLTSSKRRIRPF
jgi:hypothetical protein